MSFTSPVFLFFLVIVFICYFNFFKNNTKAQNLFLLFSSYFFTLMQIGDYYQVELWQLSFIII